jgi:hypothetical protein
LPIMYAALCRAVAAAALRSACALASESFFAQSGRTISVVITVLSVTASDVALLRPGPVAVGELRDDVDDIADVALFNGG